MIRPPPFSLNDEPALTTIPNVTEPAPERDRSGCTLARPKVWWDKHWQVRGQNCARYRPVSLSVSPSCHSPLPTPLDRNYIDNHKVVVVCSARSGSTKALGTTNLLLKASSEALQRPAVGTGHGALGTSSTPCSQDWTSPLHSPHGSRSPSRSVIPNGGLSSSLMMSSTLTMSSMHPPTENDGPAFFATVDLIRSEHMAAARSSITNLAVLGELEDEIAKDCDALRSFLMAIQVCTHCHSRNSFIHPPLRSSMRCLQDRKTQ